MGTHASTLCLLTLLLASPAAVAANTCEWSGKGTNNRWSHIGNWTNCGGGAPLKNDRLIFPAGALQPVSENDLADVTYDYVSIEGISADNTRYELTGNPIGTASSFRVTAPDDVNGSGPVIRATLRLEGKGLFVDKVSSITLAGPVTGAQVFKSGSGLALLLNPSNRWTRFVLDQGRLRLGAPGVLPAEAALEVADTATLQLNDINTSIGSLKGGGRATIDLGSATLTIKQTTEEYYLGTIKGTGGLVKNGDQTLIFALSKALEIGNSYTGPTVVNEGVLRIQKSGHTTIAGPLFINGGIVEQVGYDQIDDGQPVIVNRGGVYDLRNWKERVGSLAGAGQVLLADGTITIGADDTSTTFSGAIIGSRGRLEDSPEAEYRLVKIGDGRLTLTGANEPGLLTVVEAGELAVNGRLNGSGVLVRDRGLLTGTGILLDADQKLRALERTSSLLIAGTRLAPGDAKGMGMLRADQAEFREGTLEVRLGGLAPGGYSQLELTAGLRLDKTTRLFVDRGAFGPPAGARFTIIKLIGQKGSEGTFADLPEGGTLDVDGQRFRITYTGGDDRNDVVLTALEGPPPITYYLSEGATGAFFDDDILIANAQERAAPVTLMFSKESGEQVTATRLVPAKSRLTVHVDSIPGLEASAFSARVRSDAGVPLMVERSMFWDKTHYAGHTGASVDRPSEDWYFAEGAQGFFETFVLVINPNAEATDVTFTFFLEDAQPIEKRVTLAPVSRLTLRAGDIPALVSRAFGIAVHATRPIMAERSMYFGTTNGQLWKGGHESPGVTHASRDWFLAEGATGEFFDTFVLLSNPQRTPAQVTLQYLLLSGETITVPKTIAPNARLTTNIEAEEDPRLRNAAVSTVVSSDVPIIAERSMYWLGAAKPWGEAHNSFGVVRADVEWGLAEGRMGGAENFHTFILLANPESKAAEVTVTFLRESGAPIVKNYTVPATSRFNIDTGGVDGLENGQFGAHIAVTNQIPIIVERSMYWGPSAAPFTGGTNATGIALSPVP